LRNLGLSVLAAEEIAAPSVTTALLPEGISELEFRKAVFSKYGVALGAGPVEIGLNAFRIGTMGRTAHPEAVIPGLVAVGNTLLSFGHPCRPDAGQRAAQSVFDCKSTPELWKIANELNPSQ
jgi:aspartate aminotransferase-like enzyme